MTADRWARAVRQYVGPGRFLPLGGPGDGAWITEWAAGTVLRHAAALAVPGIRLDGLRLALADPDRTRGPAVPPPPSALPPGALRLTAGFAATAAQPLPVAASRLRAALADAAAERIGLAVTEVDLRVTELLDEEPLPVPPAAPPRRAAARAAAGTGDAGAGRVAAAVLAVPGVSRLTDGPAEPAGGAAPPRRHVRVDLAVRADHRVLDVTRAVRVAVSRALPGPPTVAVLVTAVDRPEPLPRPEPESGRRDR